MRLMLFYAPLLLYGVVLSVAVGRWKRLDACQRLIPVYSGLCILTTLGIEGLRLLSLRPTILTHVFPPLQTLIFAGMFARATPHPRRPSVLLRVATVNLGVWLAIIPWVDLTSFKGPSFHLHVALNLVMALYCLAERGEETDRPLADQAAFWLAFGLLLDASQILIHYPARDWLHAHHRALLLVLVQVRAIVVMFTHLLFWKALRCPPRTLPSSR